MATVVTLLTCASGALAGLVVPRIAHRLSVTRDQPPRSVCHRCAAPLPEGLAGWVRLPSRCSHCAARLGPPPWLTVPIGGLACGVLGAVGYPALAATVGAGPAGWVLAALVATAVAGLLLAVIDLACLRLPDPIVGATALLCLLLLGAAALAAGDAGRLLRGLLAALVLGGAYLVIALLPGAPMGLGDVKLAAVLGLLLGWLGWPAVLLGGLLPHLVNGPVVLALLLARRVDRKASLPLGPALLAGAWLAVVVVLAARRM